MSAISSKRLLEKPPTWLIQVPNEGFDLRPSRDYQDFIMRLDPMLMVAKYRAVNFSRLSTVLKSGIDVEPTDSVIYADEFEKAWEYGAWPKVVLAFDCGRLQRTFREVPSDTSPDELAVLSRTFPTKLRSKNGTKLWLSRLSEDDPKLASGYEIAYAWWTDEDPFDALKGIFVFWRPKDAQAIEHLPV